MRSLAAKDDGAWLPEERMRGAGHHTARAYTVARSGRVAKW
jgi:hypothetical protein